MQVVQNMLTSNSIKVSDMKPFFVLLLPFVLILCVVASLTLCCNICNG